MYSLSVNGDTLVAGTGFTTSAQVSYQFVIEPKNGDYIRSDVYRDLTLLPCESSPPPPTEPPSPPSTEPPSIPWSIFTDIYPPVIENIDFSDPMLICDRKITISATVVDSVSAVESGTGSVKRVVASVPGHSDVEMVYVGGNKYNATLGPFSDSISVTVHAWDNAGNHSQRSKNLGWSCIE